MPAGPPLHVLTLTPFYPTDVDDGTGCFVAEPLRHFTEYGATNTVIAVQPFYRKTQGASLSATPARWISYPALPGGLGLSSAGALLFGRLLQVVRKLHLSNPIDVIHAHSPLPCGHAAALIKRELGIPFAVTVHGLDAYSTRQAVGIAGKWCERVSRMVFAAASQVICVSDLVRQQLAPDQRNSDSIQVIYNGVDSQLFSPTNENHRSSGGRSGKILSVGSLIPTKGHELLLRAVGKLREAFPAVRCEIIGEGVERGRLEAAARSLKISDQIQFRGRQSRAEVAEAMKRCAVFALPSGYEALGCVYLEAMSSGRPAIGCRGQGIEEIIEHGKDGWLVEPGNLDDLIEALSVLLQQPEMGISMGDLARKKILRNFTLSHQAGHLVETLRKCCARA